MSDVLARMRDATGKILSSKSGGDGASSSSSGLQPLNGAHATLISWSALMSTQFKLINQHLLGGPGADVSSQLTEFSKQQGAILVKVQSQIEVVQGKLLSIERQLVSLCAGSGVDRNPAE